MNGKRLRRALLVVAGALGLLVLVAVAGLPLYVFPPRDAVPADADLVYVIGPPRAPRLAAAEQLLAESAPDRLLVSVSAAGALSASDLPVCDDADVTCGTPDPFTTAGEARMLTEYTRTHEVHDPVVVTFTPHVARTRYIFAKCYGSDVTVVGVDEHLGFFDWAYEYLYQTAAFVKAWIVPCPGA